MWSVALFLSLVGTAICRPATIETEYGNFSTKPLSPEDLEWLAKHTPTHRLSYPGFKFMYVSQNGHIVEDHRPSSGNYIEVAGSPQVPHSALYLATTEIGKVLRHAPTHIFNNIAQHHGVGVGVFTAQEKLTVFPEFANLRNTPQCGSRCDGSCSHTCTFDGRKYENIAGVTNTRSVVLVDNVLCSSHDPYHHHDNILVHEFGHTIERYGLSSSEKSQVIAAYNHAKANNLWRAGSYAMSNHAEYFAEATGSFFLVNLQSSTGGMTDCPDGHKCGSETEVRQWLHDHDRQLWTILVHVYTNGDPSIPSGLQICDHASGGGSTGGGSTGTGGSSTNCQDGNQQCPAWEARGECQTNPGYMLQNCKHSCGTCNGAPSIECQDSDSRCPGWGDRGECKNNPNYMLSHCRHTCGTCGQQLVGR